jgi:hypothetical protein
MKSKTLAEEGTPTYMGSGDPARRRPHSLWSWSTVAVDNYHPAWVDSLADDVTLEGSAINGAVQGAEAVRSIVTYIRMLYESQEFNYAGPYGENGFLEDYTALSTSPAPPTASTSLSAGTETSPEGSYRARQHRAPRGLDGRPRARSHHSGAGEGTASRMASSCHNRYRPSRLGS